MMHRILKSLGLVLAVLVLASCGSAGPIDRPHSSQPGIPTLPAQAPNPFHPAPNAARILAACAPLADSGGCFSPEQIQTFYHLTPLYARGFDGHGITIVILDAFGSPTIKADLHTFDQTFGLPDPPRFDVLAPLGQPPLNQANRDQLEWAGETTLDVEWTHAIAPEAALVLLVSPKSETQGVAGFPELEQLSIYALNHHLGQVFSQSFGASEPTLLGDPCLEHLGNGQDMMRDYDQNVYQRAMTEHITMLTVSGDTGATNGDCSQQRTYPYQNVSWPASDPFVTTVGGTQLALSDITGDQGSEKAWNEDGFASGGGLSQIYNEPAWQKSLPNQSQLHGRRAIPDVAWNAAANFPIYATFSSRSRGWRPVGGTSAACPQWSGLIAIADQLAGQSLGFLNPALYKLAGKGFHDIIQGNNSAFRVPGFSAGPGWDLATGWGTPDAAVLLPLLILAVRQAS